MKKLCLIFGICWVVSSGCFGKDAYRFLSEIPIGGEGGWDILTIDPTANRLYLSHATKVVVVDLAKNSAIGEIIDTPGVHAFVAVPELQRGFSSNGKEDKASVVDLKTLQTTSKIDTGPNPDAIVYEPKLHEVYVIQSHRKFMHRDGSEKRERNYNDSTRWQSRVCSCGRSCGSDLLQHRRQKRGCGDRHIET
jgi:hypothetical protein